MPVRRCLAGQVSELPKLRVHPIVVRGHVDGTRHEVIVQLDRYVIGEFEQFWEKQPVQRMREDGGQHRANDIGG
jgi:hypothetical protein